MSKLIECVPNFSEGRNQEVIHQIAEAIKSTADVKLLHVDIGYDANRTVMTFAGSPEGVCKAAYKAIKTAAQLIDMSKHTGEHPRMGAVDVCPLIPLANITLAETILLSKSLAKRVGTEFNIPIYLYEHSAQLEERRNLAYIRKGEYEALPQKLSQEHWKPDYGPNTFNAKAGATVMGARNFLIAYNVNLNTRDVSIARKIAGMIRESGYKVNGVRKPGKHKTLKAIGWWMEEYDCAQVSMNLTDINTTSTYMAFEACKEAAQSLGYEVKGSELIGMIPLSELIKAGKFYAKGTILSEADLVDLAIKKMGLDALAPFDPNSKVIEYKL